MAEFVVGSNTVTLSLTSFEQLESFHGDFTFPRSAITAVRVSEDLFDELRGLRAPGTAWPRVVMVGTLRGSFGKDFAVIRHGERGVVVELRDQEFERLLVTCDSPEEQVRALTAGAT